MTMKNKISKYKTQLAEIPAPLQKQVFIRLGFALVFLLLFILVLFTMFDWLTIVPFIALSVYNVISAFMLFHRAVAGGYVVIQGSCVETASTIVRKKTKSVLIETEDHLVRIILRQRLKRIPKGAELEFYVADNTQVFERDGAKLIHTYLAINMKETAQSEKSKKPV